jgi:hypothetical protein
MTGLLEKAFLTAELLYTRNEVVGNEIHDQILKLVKSNAMAWKLVKNLLYFENRFAPH